jgi:hypothetical protein
MGLIPLASAVTVAVIATSQTRETDLLAQARPVVNAPRLDLRTPYQWLSDGRLLVGPSAVNQYHASVHDTRTGQHDPAPRTAVYLTKFSRGKESMGAAIVLPDGACLSWPRGISVTPHEPVGLGAKAGYSGGGALFWTGWQPARVWRKDARGWVAVIEFYNGWHLLHYQTEPSRTIMDIPLTVYMGQREASPCVFRGGSTNGDFPRVGLGLDKESRALTVPMFLNMNSGRVNLGRLARGQDAPVTVSLPQDARPYEVAISPSGDKLAWLLWFDKPSSYPRWMRPWLPPAMTRDQNTVALYTSLCDGRGMRLIGQIPLTNQSRVFPSAMAAGLGSLEWTPDGKRLSFIYSNALYTVPAD